MNKLGSALGKLAAGLGMLASAEALAETSPAQQQVDRTFQGVESCGIHLREIRLAEEAKGNTYPRAYWGNQLADCRNAQLQATLAEQEATLAEQEATLAALDEQLAAKGLKVENRQLLTLEGDLLGYLTTQDGQVHLDLSPWDERNDQLAADVEQALADFEQFLMNSLAG